MRDSCFTRLFCCARCDEAMNRAPLFLQRVRVNQSKSCGLICSRQSYAIEDWSVLQRTNYQGGSSCEKFRQRYRIFQSFLPALCLENGIPILRLATNPKGVSAYCCSAALRSLIVMPPPFLGVSSLNLAALRSGHFFCAGQFASLACVAAVAHGPIKPTSLAAPGSAPQNPSRKIAQGIRSIRRLAGARWGGRGGRGGWR